MNVAVRAAKHAAPGPYLGFALQPVRLCYHLLTCPGGAHVSLELLDDVAVHYADGSLALEQTKSALRQNPLSDWAADLWKAIANWLDSAASGAIDPKKCQFQIYVSPFHTGSLAAALNDCNSDADVEELAAAVASNFKKKKPTACAPYVQRFLSAGHDERAAIITRLAIVSETDPLESLRALIKTTIVPELVDVLCESAIGMAKEQADELIRQGSAAQIDGDRFKANFIAFVQRNNLPGLLTSLTERPNEIEVTAILVQRPTFIRQLKIIDSSYDDRVRAVSDYLRSSADKTRWAETGAVFEGSLREFDDSLVWRHGLVSDEVADVSSHNDPARQGRAIYRRCAQLQIPIDGRAVPEHFVHGCFNALADDMRLGWHPEYESLLGLSEE
ncbi:ABC-three component system protein [Bradyrhizobium sp. STM 3561]|uniref:ABC-three component system protein n=1 Tax=Bradyrhizobium sp. STM 3561 TaxID=578923 RepID=UPI00388ECD24